jgi:hypothetical protein
LASISWLSVCFSSGRRASALYVCEEEEEEEEEERGGRDAPGIDVDDVLEVPRGEERGVPLRIALLTGGCRGSKVIRHTQTQSQHDVHHVCQFALLVPSGGSGEGCERGGRRDLYFTQASLSCWFWLRMRAAREE